MDLPAGFALAAVLEREDARDAWVSNRYAALAELPQGAVVGTSSLRRVVQLAALRPDLRLEPLGATSTRACASSTKAVTTRSSSPRQGWSGSASPVASARASPRP